VLPGGGAWRGAFRAAEVSAAINGADEARVARVLRALRREGRLRCLGRGPGAVWERSERS